MNELRAEAHETLGQRNAMMARRRARLAEMAATQPAE